MEQRRLILIATHVDPWATRRDVIGSIRPNLMLRLLPDQGWLPIVVTTGPENARTTEGEVLIRQVRAGSLVGRTKAAAGVSLAPGAGVGEIGQLSRSKRLVTEIASLVPDSLAWAIRTAGVASALARKHSADIFLSTSPSPAAHLAAGLAAVATGLPWVAELRDLWSQQPAGVGTTARRGPDAAFERLLFRRAAALVTVSEDLADQLRTIHAGIPVYSIPTGFDRDLLAPSGTVPSEQFLLVYAGRVSDRQDPLRVLRPLARALEQGLIDRSAVRVELLTMGTLGEVARAYIRDHALHDVIVERDILPRAEVLELERTAQILLHFRWDDAAQPGIMTGKLSEYLVAGRPILSTGAFDDEVTTVLQSTGAGVATTTDEQTEDFLVDAFRTFRREGAVPFIGRPSEIDRYDGVHMAAAMARVLAAAADA